MTGGQQRLFPKYRQNGTSYFPNVVVIPGSLSVGVEGGGEGGRKVKGAVAASPDP